jgi:hypothetical protein
MSDLSPDWLGLAMVVWMPPKCPAWRPNCLAIWVQQVQLGSAASLGGRSVMSGNIFNSNGIHVGVMEGAAIFDLKGRKLYNLKGINIYRLSGELVGHLNGAQGSDKRLDRSTDRLFPARGGS